MSVHRRASARKLFDLFDVENERELRASNPAARKLARQFGVSIRHAAVLARLNGLGPERTR